MNNCATRTALSGVMGLGLGVLFGIFMGTMDGAVRIWFALLVSDSCSTDVFQSSCSLTLNVDDG